MVEIGTNIYFIPVHERTTRVPGCSQRALLPTRNSNTSVRNEFLQALPDLRRHRTGFGMSLSLQELGMETLYKAKTTPFPHR
jgi:hypothetical protein